MQCAEHSCGAASPNLVPGYLTDPNVIFLILVCVLIISNKKRKQSIIYKPLHGLVRNVICFFLAQHMNMRTWNWTLL